MTVAAVAAVVAVVVVAAVVVEAVGMAVVMVTGMSAVEAVGVAVVVEGGKLEWSSKEDLLAGGAAVEAVAVVVVDLIDELLESDVCLFIMRMSFSFFLLYSTGTLLTLTILGVTP